MYKLLEIPIIIRMRQGILSHDLECTGSFLLHIQGAKPPVASTCRRRTTGVPIVLPPTGGHPQKKDDRELSSNSTF